MIELGLQRISRLLASSALRFRAIHVAGTNGKGSVCHMISHMLEAYNTSSIRTQSGAPRLQHGRFTSPHLVHRWDCITIDQQTVSSALFDSFERLVLERNSRLSIGASEFEILTATAFELFEATGVDVAVVEVGMGGRLDATNILGQKASTPASRAEPLVTAVTKIGLDHQDFLGDTLEKIAREKAGIFKPGVPVVYDTSNPDSVKEVLEEMAAGNRIVRLTDPAVDNMHTDGPVPYPNLFVDELEVANDVDAASRAATPSHTRQNLSVAFRSAWTALQRLDCIPTEIHKLGDPHQAVLLSELANEMMDAALNNQNYGGRLQTIHITSLTGRTEPILLDGAHNAQSAEVLGGEVKRLREEAQANGGSRSVTWVIAMSTAKAADDILRPLLEVGDTVFAVEFGSVDGMPWVTPKHCAELAYLLGQGYHNVGVRICGNDVPLALRRASENAAGGPLVVAGSLYLVSDVLRLLQQDDSRA